MRTSSQDADRTKKLAISSAFLCAALMLSLAEAFVFPAGILPIPGTKLGLANSAVLLCATLMGRRYAAAVSLSRVVLMFFLFGSGTSVIYALSGAVLSFVGIALFCNSTRLSFLGKSVIAAILHNTAQIMCAAFILGQSVLLLFPWMTLSAVLCGSITGILLNLSYGPVKKYAGSILRIKT